MLPRNKVVIERIISILLAISMTMSGVPTMALAEAVDELGNVVSEAVQGDAEIQDAEDAERAATEDAERKAAEEAERLAAEEAERKAAEEAAVAEEAERLAAEEAERAASEKAAKAQQEAEAAAAAEAMAVEAAEADEATAEEAPAAEEQAVPVAADEPEPEASAAASDAGEKLSATLEDVAAEDEAATTVATLDVADADQNGYVTSLTVSPETVDSYSKVTVALSFSDGSPNEHVFHSGDTITVDWPSSGDAYIKGYSKTIQLYSDDGVNYGTAVVTSSGCTITFNSNVDTMYDVSGSIWFEAMAVNNTDTTEENTKTVTITSGNKTAELGVHKGASGNTGEAGELPDFRKQADSIGGGWSWNEGLGEWVMGLNPDDPTYTQWILTANENCHEIKSDITVHDAMGEGQQLDPSWAKLYSTGDTIKETYEGTVAEVAASFAADFPGSSLSIASNGDVDWTISKQAANKCGWVLVYRCSITDFSLVTFDNTATISWEEPDGTTISSTSESHFANVDAGGSINVLPRGVLQLTKGVSGTEVYENNEIQTALTVSGVVFVVEIQNASGGWDAVGTISTNGEGTGLLTKLKSGHYRIYEDESSLPEHLEAKYTQDNPYEFDFVNENTTDHGLDLGFILNDVKTIDIEANKVWRNANGSEDTSEHPTIYLQLYRSSRGRAPIAYRDAAELANGTTSVSWENLPAYDVRGNEYTYTVREVDADGNETAPEGYTCSVTGDAANGFTVTNTVMVAPPTTSVSVAKVWRDGPYDEEGGENTATIGWPSYVEKVSVQLQQTKDGKTTDVDGKTLDLTSDSQRGSFDGLPVYEGVTYSVREAGVTFSNEAGSGYFTAEITNPSGSDGTFVVTNTIYTVGYTVNKTWVDGDNRDGVRPASIRVHLLKPDGSAATYYDGSEVEPLTLTAGKDGSWSGEFTGVPQYDAKGNRIEYTVREEMDGPAATSYVATISGTSITNTHAPETTEVSVTKAWDDAMNQDGKRPSGVKVQLLADGEAYGEPVTLNAAGGWRYTWADLYKNKDGAAIAYTVEELPVEGYASYITGSADDGFTLTNTHVPEQTSATVSKVWDDGDDADGLRSTSVTMQLQKSVAGVVSNVSGVEVTLSADNGWTATVDGLDAYEAGQLITYSFVERDVPDGYAASYKVTRNAKGYTTTVTNSHVPATVYVNVAKKWDDGNDLDGIRPSSVTVDLLANGEKTGQELTLSAKNHWKATFTGLAPHDARGKTITYSVKERPVRGYTPSYTKDDTGTVTITNRLNSLYPHTPSGKNPSKGSSSSDSSGLPQTGDVPLQAAVCLACAGAIATAAGLVRRKREE